jgi:hypothetical protein
MNRERNPGVSQTALSTGSFGCASIHLEGRDSRKLSSLTRKVGERTAKPRRAGGGGGAERRKIQIAAQSSRAIRFSVIPAPSSISARFAKANYAADVRTGAALSAPRQRRGTRRREEAEEEDDTGATQSAFLRGAELLD